MDTEELKSKFTEEFFEEFYNQTIFRSSYESMVVGVSPYYIIERLCKYIKDQEEELIKLNQTRVEPSHDLIDKVYDDIMAMSEEELQEARKEILKNSLTIKTKFGDLTLKKHPILKVP